MTQVRVIDSGVLSPEKIMEKDAQLLENLQLDPCPILHFYEWEGDCLTYGYFTNPADYLDLTIAERLGLKMARRPTGGGVIFHLYDLAFSVLIPVNHPGYFVNSLDNYAYINRIVAQAISNLTQHSISTQLWCENQPALERPNFCMAKPTQYDLVVNGKKLGGAAQRRKKWGYLHQGSLSLSLPSTHLIQVVKDPALFQSMMINSYPLIAQFPHLSDLKDLRQLIMQSLNDTFLQTL